MGGFMDFIIGCGWVSVTAYCLNTLGFVNMEALRSQFDSSYHPQAVEISPSPSPSPSPEGGGNDDSISAIE